MTLQVLLSAPAYDSADKLVCRYDLNAKLIPVCQVWVHEVEAEDDLQLFEDLPHHLRAQVAWRQNRELMGSIHTFKVCVLT